MREMLGHNVLSSIKEFFNYRILKDCSGYTNRTVSLYNYTDKRFTGMYVYGSPYSNFVYHGEVNGPVIASGLFNTGFVARGTNGLVIDYKNGRFLSTGIQTGTLTANVAVADINTYVTTSSDTQLISETNFLTLPDNRAATGYLPPYSHVTSALFFRNFQTTNDDLCFAGLDWTVYKIRLVGLMKNSVHLNAIADIIRDCRGRIFPLISNAETPLNEYGDLKSGWNYNSFLASNSYGFIDEAVFNYVQPDVFIDKNPKVDVFVGTIEVRIPRVPLAEFP